MVRAAECCNQHLKNIVALRHFHFCCLWLLETEGNSLRAVFEGSASSVWPLPDSAATAPASPISPGHFPQLKLILSIPRPPACLPPACWPPACHTVPEPACDLFHSPVKSYLLYLGTPRFGDVFKQPDEGKLPVFMWYNTCLPVLIKAYLVATACSCYISICIINNIHLKHTQKNPRSKRKNSVLLIPMYSTKNYILRA